MTARFPTSRGGTVYSRDKYLALSYRPYAHSVLVNEYIFVVESKRVLVNIR